MLDRFDREGPFPHLKDLSHTYKTIHRLSEVIRKAIYERRAICERRDICERREEWLGVLTGEVEADDVHLPMTFI